MTEQQLQQATDKLQQRAAGMDAIGGTVLLDLGDDQGIWLDGRHSPMRIDRAVREADCRVRLSFDLLNDILGGERNAFMAFMTGQIGINGDMSVAIKLRPLLSAG